MLWPDLAQTDEAKQNDENSEGRRSPGGPPSQVIPTYRVSTTFAAARYSLLCSLTKYTPGVSAAPPSPHPFQ